MPPMPNRVKPALQGNLKMIRYIAGSGPLYIRSMLDIKKSENYSSSNEDSDLSDNECEDVSKTTLPSFRRIMTIDLDNSSKNAVSNLSESADKIEPKPSNFDKNGKEKFEMSHSFQRTDGNTVSQKVVTGTGNHFKKPILTDESKKCCPTCHKQFHISVIAHHADSCAENSVKAYETAYDDLFNDEEWNIEEHINAIEASDPNHSGCSDILNSRKCLDSLKNIWNAALDSCAKTLLLPATRVEVRRKYAWQDYIDLRRKFWFNVKNAYRITFTLEPAVDGGGPRREFFSSEYRKLYIQRYTYQKLLEKVRY